MYRSLLVAVVLSGITCTGLASPPTFGFNDNGILQEKFKDYPYFPELTAKDETEQDSSQWVFTKEDDWTWPEDSSSVFEKTCQKSEQLFKESLTKKGEQKALQGIASFRLIVEGASLSDEARDAYYKRIKDLLRSVFPDDSEWEVSNSRRLD